MDEPSLLDYIKGRLFPWKYPRIELPPEESPETTPSSDSQPPGGSDFQPEIDKPIATISTSTDQDIPITYPVEEKTRISTAIPWSAIVALVLALFAQNLLEPSPSRNPFPGIIVYLVSFIFLGLAVHRKEWQIAPFPEGHSQMEQDIVRLPELAAGLVFAFLTFLTSGNNRFSIFNLILVSISTILVMRAFWIPTTYLTTILQRMRQAIRRKSWTIHITPETLLLVGALLLVLFFRFHRLSTTPAEMNSDHAEKILDVMRVLQGQTMIFFPTNGGREAFQMYSIVALNKVFNLPVDYLALKLSSSLAGLIALGFIYLLGNEIANRRVALFAFTFAGVAYWTNVVSRMGLRLPFYILFTSAVLFFLIRGIKNNHRNDFLFAGLCLGLSFYGYTADRILPFLVIAIIAFYLLHRDSILYRRATLLSTLGLILVAFVVSMPLLRFIIDYPDAFLFRSLSRVGSIERPLENPALLVFIKNLWNALVMFSWKNGEVWTLSIPYRPALDIVTGALYWIGLGLVTVRSVQKRHWIDLSLLISIPILMLPSVMSLAFPAENPNLYRTGGAAVPVFLLIALAVDGLMTSFENRLNTLSGKLTAWILAVVLLVGSSLYSYDLVFQQYDQQYRLSAWNSSEIGSVIRNFSETIGTPDTAYVIGYPHWVDTRLVAFIAGIFPRDPYIPVNRLEETQDDRRPKIFILKPEDELAIATLKDLYPQGTMTTYTPQVPTKEFIIFYVPPSP